MSNIYIKHNIPISYISWDKRGFAILSVCEGSSNALTFSRSKTFAFWVKFALSQFWWKWDFILAAFGGKFEQLATSALLLLHIAGKMGNGEYQIRKKNKTNFEPFAVISFLAPHIAVKMVNSKEQQTERERQWKRIYVKLNCICTEIWRRYAR